MIKKPWCIWWVFIWDNCGTSAWTWDIILINFDVRHENICRKNLGKLAYPKNLWCTQTWFLCTFLAEPRRWPQGSPNYSIAIQLWIYSPQNPSSPGSKVTWLRYLANVRLQVSFTNIYQSHSLLITKSEAQVSHLHSWDDPNPNPNNLGR